MERSPTDEVEAADVALADDLPSTSGAHWANRDLHRGRTPFRRPPAQPETAGIETGTESSTPVDDRVDTSWFAPVPASPAPVGPQPEPAAPTRASFGITEEPISGHWVGADPSPISPASSPSHASPEQARFDEWASAAPREIHQHRAESPQRGQHHQEPPRRSKLLVGATVALTATVLLGGAAAGVAYFNGDDKELTSVLELGAGDNDGSDGVVATAPLGGRTAATFELVAATRRTTLKTQDLGDELFRITAAGDSGTAPRPAVSKDKVQLLLAADKDAARGNVEVLLSSKVTWALRFTGGADEQIVDMTGGKVSSVDVTGASRRVALTLPTPNGTVPLRITGAVQDLSLASPKDSPVRIQVASGAKTVAAGTRTLRDVEPGSTLTPKQWKVPNRYDVDAESRLTLLTVRTVS